MRVSGAIQGRDWVITLFDLGKGVKRVEERKKIFDSMIAELRRDPEVRGIRILASRSHPGSSRYSVELPGSPKNDQP
jgi:hypothetical protein